jgi:hypothetical protein
VARVLQLRTTDGVHVEESFGRSLDGLRTATRIELLAT